MNMAQKLLDCKDFDLLWSEVDTVERVKGGDLYTYPDGSKLLVSSKGSVVA